MTLLWARRGVLLDLPLRISNLPALSSRKCLGVDLQWDYLDLPGLRGGSPCITPVNRITYPPS